MSLGSLEVLKWLEWRQTLLLRSLEVLELCLSLRRRLTWESHVVRLLSSVSVVVERFLVLVEVCSSSLSLWRSQKRLLLRWWWPLGRLIELLMSELLLREILLRLMDWDRLWSLLMLLVLNRLLVLNLRLVLDLMLLVDIWMEWLRRVLARQT